MFISPDNEYPRYEGDIMLAHPDWSVGDDLPTGWVRVLPATSPSRGKYQVIEEGFPNEVDGVFTQNLYLREMTDEERAKVDAPETAKTKLVALGFTEVEIRAIAKTKLVALGFTEVEIRAIAKGLVGA